MPEPNTILVISGKPGSGKTTAVMRALSDAKPSEVSGFITEEVREKGKRIGFDIVLLGSGKRLPLARVGGAGPKVGRYAVNLGSLEEAVEAALQNIPRDALVVIDEVGKMECTSHRFRKAVEDIVQSGNHLLATVGPKTVPLVRWLTGLPQTKVLDIDALGRNTVKEQITQWLRRIAR